MDRFTNAFEALLAALADAVKQLGEGSQQPWARTRVEEAKQDFVNCCDVMCFQLKQAMEMIRQEMLQYVPSAGLPQAPGPDSERVRQVLDAVEAFAAQLRDPAVVPSTAGGGLVMPVASAAAAAAVAVAVATTPAAQTMAAAGFGPEFSSGMYSGTVLPAAAAAAAATTVGTLAPSPSAASALATQSVAVAAAGTLGHVPQQQQYQQGMGGYGPYAQ
ncbi:hypothetical protein VaNZ11_010765 [Volvox africanus]|uniref:Uncharacterized protein n=1 Tax=Volvox africanus TaxID=51714 RepID=A0ABQ5SA46_9CHLO|nr:hypothetical protein VaNZ11_010765 [Volvox africanus]